MTPDNATATVYRFTSTDGLRFVVAAGKTKTAARRIISSAAGPWRREAEVIGFDIGPDRHLINGHPWWSPSPPPEWVSTIGASRNHLYKSGQTAALCGYEGTKGNETDLKARPRCKHCTARTHS